MKTIEIRENGVVIASATTDSVKGRFQFLQKYCSPVIAGHGGIGPNLDDKTVESGLVTYRCTDGAVITETIINH